MEAVFGYRNALCDAVIVLILIANSFLLKRKLNRGSNRLRRRIRSGSNWLLLVFGVGLSCGGRGNFRCWLRRSGARLRAALHLGVANRLDLRQTLLFFVHAHRDELDHLLGNAQTALDLRDQRALCGNVHQNVKAVVELTYGVGEPASAHLLNALHLAATVRDVPGKTLNQLVELCFFNVRPDDEHDFVGTIHSFTSFCEVLLRTVLTSVLPTRSGKFLRLCCLYSLACDLLLFFTSLRLVRSIVRTGKPAVELTHRGADPLGQHHLNSTF